MSDDQQHLQPASADEVRARRAHPHIIMLPSGITVQIKKASLIELAAAGKIPDELTTQVLVGLSEALDEAREQTPVDARKTMQRRLDLINAVCAAILVSPRMVIPGRRPDQQFDGDGHTIVPEDLTFEDRAHLYGVCLGTQEGPNLSPFPGGQSADLAPVEDGAGVQHEAVGAAGGH